ncbi:MAG TPA: YcnI family protein [Thermoleophilaceae bacterium]|nr:YcnI family protein [Thermoleophilaceae bacterium]
MGIKTTAALMAAASLALAAPATAHVTIEPGEAPADGYATLDVQVPHGCDGSGTTAVRVKVPRSVPSVTPQVHLGWEVTTEEGPKDAVELHGERVTRGVSEVTWTARDAGPLPDGRLDVFGMSVKLPAGRAGDRVYFPTVQECERGKTAWIQIPAAGESEDDLESPAPAVTLAAGSAESAAGDSDDEPAMALVVAALALGGLGASTGFAALVQRRRDRSPDR